MESSENISPSAFQRVKGFLNDVVRYLLTTASDRQVGVILYNSEATKEIAFGQYTSEFGFNEAIDKLPHEKGQPRIEAALQLAAEMFASSGGMVFNLLAQCPVAFTESRLIRPCHKAAILPRGTKKSLLYHAKPHPHGFHCEA